MPQLSPWLWFDTQAEEAANFYVSVFKNSRVLDVSRTPDGGPGEPGNVMVVSFELDGQQFNALNGGPHFTFSEAVSFQIHCEDQAEVDEYWARLTADGGQESDCGWLKDKFGLSWQVTPAEIPELLTGPKSDEVMQAVMQMKKLDLHALRRAAGKE